MNAHATMKSRPLNRDLSGPSAHAVMGVALAAGAVVAAGLIAHSQRPPADFDQYDGEYAELVAPVFKPKKAIFGLVWPPLMMALTLSGLRIWNAPPSEERTRALTMWSLVQGFNAVWMAAGPKRVGGQVTASVASLATTAAYAWSARKVDAPVANLAGPYLGWMGMASLITEQLWKRPKPY